MLLLASTSDKIRLTTGSALTVDVHASWIDNASGAITPGRTNTAITTATTTDIVASPASSTQRNVKAISIRNKDSSSDVVTVLHTDGSTIVQLFSCTLLTGEELCFDETTGWKHFTSAGSIKFDPIPQIGNNQILANTSGAQAAPVGTILSTYLDSAVSSTVGTLLTRGVSGWGALNFTSGSVPFQSTTVLTEDNVDFFWDNTNKRLGISSVASPSYPIHIGNSSYGIDAKLGLWTGDGVRTRVWTIRTIFGGASVTDPNYGFAIRDEFGNADRLNISFNTGNVGIGTGTPGSKLDVAGDINTSGDYRIGGVLLAQRNTNYFEFTDPDGGDAFYLGNATDPQNYHRNNIHTFQSRGAGVVFVRIDSTGLAVDTGVISCAASGNLLGSAGGDTTTPTRTNTNIKLYDGGSSNWSGIGSDTAGTMYFVTGTSSPATRLTITPSGTAFFSGTVGTTALGNQLGSAGGSLASPTTTNTNIVLYLNNSTTNWAGIGSDTGGTIYFVTGIGGGGGNPSTRVSINTAGTVRFHNYGAGTLVTDANGTITASSDAALKENIADYKAGLDEVLNLHPISFNWTEESELDTENEYVGFIAQEVEPHLPHAIGEDSYGTKTITDRVIIAALVNAVKELSAKVEALEAKGQSER